MCIFFVSYSKIQIFHCTIEKSEKLKNKMLSWTLSLVSIHFQQSKIAKNDV